MKLRKSHVWALFSAVRRSLMGTCAREAAHDARLLSIEHLNREGQAALLGELRKLEAMTVAQ